MRSKDKEREERLAAALRENLRKRKAQARILPGTGRGIAEGGGGAEHGATDPSASADALPRPRSGED